MCKPWVEKQRQTLTSLIFIKLDIPKETKPREVTKTDVERKRADNLIQEQCQKNVSTIYSRFVWP